MQATQTRAQAVTAAHNFYSKLTDDQTAALIQEFRDFVRARMRNPPGCYVPAPPPKPPVIMQQFTRNNVTVNYPVKFSNVQEFRAFLAETPANHCHFVSRQQVIAQIDAALA
jgi:hypothetical protein